MVAIINVAAKVVRSFNALVAALLNPEAKHAHLIDNEALQDEFGRFRVWAGNLGALQKGHSSLDYRLRDSPLLLDETIKLLDELETNLSEAFAVVTGARLPYEEQAKFAQSQSGDEKDSDDDDFFSEDEDEDEEDSNAPAPSTELEQRFQDVVDINDNLYRHSVRIRRPTLRNRSLKAASYRPKDPESGIDLLEQYATFDLLHTRELVGSLRTPHVAEMDVENDLLVDRLSQAITLRRRQFKYWKRHRDKLSVSTLLEDREIAFLERPELPPRNHTIDVVEAHPETLAVITPRGAVSEKTNKTMLSGTEATFHHEALDDLVDLVSVTSYATTVRDLSGRGIELPPPPRVADGDKDFECPYCFIICPARYGRGRSWRTHLLQDLQPYICTYTECNDHNQLFRSRREWSEHEGSHRKAWRCPEHPTAIYKSKAGLENHLRQEHSGTIPDNQLDTIVNIGETSTVDTREKCPICLVDSQAEGVKDNLQNHIANHLERLAAFALPTTDSIGDGVSGGSSMASRGRTTTTISSQESISQEEGDVVNRSQSPFVKTAENSVSVANRLLFAETLENLPDDSGKRLDVLRSSNLETNDFVENDEDTNGGFTGLEEHMSSMHEFRSYLLSFPGADSTRFHRRFGVWLGYVKFDDENSAKLAIESIEKTREPRFPDVKFSQGVENTALVKFRFMDTEQSKPIPSRKSTQDEKEKESSRSSRTVSYNGDAYSKGKLPILPVEEITNLRALYRTSKLQQRDQSYAPVDSYNQLISFCLYDITRLQVDAIVNSANRSNKVTRSNDNLNYYIHKAAGPGLLRECKQVGRIKEGQSKLTAGYNLPASYVIHAARPQYYGSKGMAKLNSLTECYRSSLKLALSHGIETIAFPSLGAGGCGFPPRVAARIALQEVREFLDVYKTVSLKRIIFCVFNGTDEKAYKDLIPVFFPPTHGDIEHAMPVEEPGKELVPQLKNVYTQVEQVVEDLTNLSASISDFPPEVLPALIAISSTLRSMNVVFMTAHDPMRKVTARMTADIDLICSVLQGVCGSIIEVVEQAKHTNPFAQPSSVSIWDDFNSHLNKTQGLDIKLLLELCQDFILTLDNILERDATPPYELTTMRVRLASYRLKQTGEGDEGVRDKFEEVMYTREFQRDASTSSRADTINLNQIPSLARLYQVGELEQKETMSIPDHDFNSTVCLIREDITRIESDVICNSTDRNFSGSGTLDRTVFRKGGPDMQLACSNFGVLNDGDVRVTPGFQLRARHVIHTIPPETYRSNTKDVLRKIYREVLWTSNSLKARSIAIPAIGTGMLNYPRRECASLALEEVKRFLETAKNSHRIEMIIFCVFGSNDEFIYKSLLPIYFPPADTNVNKAIAIGSTLSRSSTNSTTSFSQNSDTYQPKRRSLFSSFSQAFRGLSSRKQSMPQASRPLHSIEEDTFINFEKHARDCSTCTDIARLYDEGQRLCVDGYGAAQQMLNFVHMKDDGSVYMTGIGNVDHAKRVDIPSDYMKCLELLKVVEKSNRDSRSLQPFVSPRIPYYDQGTDIPPPGVTIYNAEVEVPIRREREPEKAFAHIFTYSLKSQELEPVYEQECTVFIYPGKVEVSVRDEGRHTHLYPSMAIELTPLVPLFKSESQNVIVRAKPTLEPRFKVVSDIVFRSESTIQRDMLYERLKHAKQNNPAYLARHPKQDTETSTREGGPQVKFDLPSVPQDDLTTVKLDTPSLLTQQLRAAERYSLQSGEATNENIRLEHADPASNQSSRTRVVESRIQALLQGASALGMHEEDISAALRESIPTVRDAIRELQSKGLAHYISEEQTWASLDFEVLVSNPGTEQNPATEEQVPAIEGQPPSDALNSNDPGVPTKTTWWTKRVLAFLKAIPDDNSVGVHVQDIATNLNLTVEAVIKAGGDLIHLGLVRTTTDEYHLSAIGIDRDPVLPGQRASIGTEAENANAQVDLGADLPKEIVTAPKKIELKHALPHLSHINIEPFFSYLLEKTHDRGPAQPKPDNESPMSSEIKGKGAQDTDPEHEKSYNQRVPSTSEEDDQDSHLPAIHNPRPTTPDHTQSRKIPIAPRWTRIASWLVSPEILEEANEEYEEQGDSVVVYRVLSRDEVKHLADRTRERLVLDQGLVVPEYTL